MTKSELREKIDELSENESSDIHLRSKDRRVQDIQKSDRPLRIMNYGGYAPHRGYIDWGFDGRTLLHTGKYIKYPTARGGSSERPADEAAAVGTHRERKLLSSLLWLYSDGQLPIIFGEGCKVEK